MQTVSKKALFAGAIAVVGLAGIAPLARANSMHGERDGGRESMHASRHGGGLLERLKEIRGERQEFHGGKHQRSLPGTVVSFDGTTLVLTKGVKTYTVTTTDTTKFVDRKWQAIDKTTIVAGHKVTLKGTVNGLNVDATMVRDVSLPTKTTSPETAS